MGDMQNVELWGYAVLIEAAIVSLLAILIITWEYRSKIRDWVVQKLSSQAPEG
jgi:hypothetical protein